MDTDFSHSVQRTVKLRSGCKWYFSILLLLIIAAFAAIIAFEVYDFVENTPPAEPITTEIPTNSNLTSDFDDDNQVIGAGINSTDIQHPTTSISLELTIPPPLGSTSGDTTLSQVFGPHSVVGWLVGVVVLLGLIVVFSVVCMSQGTCQESPWFQKHCCARGQIASIARTSAIEASFRHADRSASIATQNLTRHRSSAADTESTHYHPTSIMSQVSQTTDQTARVSVVTVSFSDTSSVLGTSPPPPYIVAIRLPTPGTTPDQSPGFLEEEENTSMASVNLPTYEDCMTF